MTARNKGLHGQIFNQHACMHYVQEHNNNTNGFHLHAPDHICMHAMFMHGQSTICTVMVLHVNLEFDVLYDDVQIQCYYTHAVFMHPSQEKYLIIQEWHFQL